VASRAGGGGVEMVLGSVKVGGATNTGAADRCAVCVGDIVSDGDFLAVT
jgi:hypothetical protein